LSVHDGKPEPSWQTGLSEARNCENVDIFPDTRPDPDDDEGNAVYARLARHRSGQDLPVARLRRVGWLDQKGRVWLATPPAAQFDGGSLTPLLIDPGERDGL
jgi:hypothetical protein